MKQLLYLTLLLFTISCSTSQNSGATNASSRTNGTGTVREVENNAQDLTDYLRNVSGVNVRGSGAAATILIRGVQSISLTNEPLFVLDGNIAGHGISSVYSAVNIQEVKRIRVLKKSSDTARYGSRGSNGVIVIETN